MYTSLGVLAGCFSVTTRQPYFSVEQTHLDALVCRAQENHLFCSGDHLERSWWKMFGDESLNQMIDIALQAHPSIQQAQERIEWAYAKAKEVRAQLLPSFDLFGEYSRQRQSLYNIGIPAFVPLVEGDNLWFNTATLLAQGAYELDVWGKNRNQYYAQLGQLQVQVTDFQQARLTLSTLIVEAYFNLQSHLKQKEILTQQVEARNNLLALMRQKKTTGESGLALPLNADAQLVTGEDQLVYMQGLIDIDRHAIAALVGNLGTDCDWENICPEEREIPCMPLPNSLPLDLIIRRPDLMSSLWNVQSQGYQVKVAKAQFFPNLDLMGVAGSISFLIRKFMSGQSLDVLGSVASTLPLYTGGALTAQLAEAQAALDLSVAQYNQILLESVREVSDGISNLIIADERERLMQEATEAYLAIYELNQQRFKSGVDSKILLLNAEDKWLNQKNTHEASKLSRMIAMVQLIKAIGGGYGANS